jgi:hypothetical protein
MASQIKVNEIIKQSGSSITIGESGDTINLGAALPVGSGGTGSTTLAGAGLASSPMFRAYNTGGFTASADTMTSFADTEVFDIGSCYDTSTKRFTPNESGYYFFIVNARTNSTSTWNYLSARLLKNGSQFAVNVNNNVSTGSVHITGVCQLNGSSDYVEGQIYCNSSSRDFYAGESENSFTGFKLVGV